MEKFEILIKTLHGLEEVLAEELRSIGAEEIQVLKRAVRCKGDEALLYKSNYLLRTALSVLKPIASFKAFNERKLYAKIKQIDWNKYLDVKSTFAVDAVTFGEVFTHSHYAALTVKDAIADQFREQNNVRPSVDTENPDLRINIHIADRLCTLSLDSSGESLMKRGYKQAVSKAPLSEVLGAGMIMLSGWDKKTDFTDPMSGSGTLPIEAALMARNIPPGSFRAFSFMKWKNFDPELWVRIKQEAKAEIQPLPCKIRGFDKNRRAVNAALENANRAGVANDISIERQDFFRSEPESPGGLLLINPPYGERLEDPDEMTEFYTNIGDRLKQQYQGFDAWVLSSNIQALKHIGLRPSRKIKLFNGPLECSFRKFSLYAGSRK